MACRFVLDFAHSYGVKGPSAVAIRLQISSKFGGRAARKNAFSLANAKSDRIEVGTLGREETDLRTVI